MPKRSRKRDLALSMPGPQTKSAKPSDTAEHGKARSPHKAAGKARSPRKAASKGRKRPSESSDTAGKAGIDIPASETPFAIKDAVLQELIGMGKVNVVIRSSKLSRSEK